MSPNFIFHCPVCQARINATPAHVGVKMPCPKCGQRLQVPVPPKKPDPTPNRTVLGKIEDLPGAPSFRPASATASPPASQRSLARFIHPAALKAVKRPWVLAVGGVVGLCLLVLLSYFVWYLMPHPKPTPTPPDPPTPGPLAVMTTDEVSAHCEPSVTLIKNKLGSGSGFLVDKGFVVTNSHVIAEDTIANVDVTFPSTDHKDQKYKVRLVYEDRKRDLAILQLLEAAPAPALPLFPGKPVKNQEVVVIGSPGIAGVEGGLSVNSSYSGHLNNVDLNFEMKGIEGERQQVAFSQFYEQYDSQTNPGNSGGPVLNMHGEVIAVHDAHQHASGARLAIPGPDLRTAFDNAAARDQKAIDHANALHNAHCITFCLEKATETYIGADLHCAHAGQDAAKAGKPAGPAYAAAKLALKDLQKKALQEAQQSGTEPDFIYPDFTRSIFLDEKWDQIPDAISSSSLDDGVKSKLHQLRDLYLKAKGIYELPSGDIDDVAQQVLELAKEYLKLADSIDNEFGFVF